MVGAGSVGLDFERFEVGSEFRTYLALIDAQRVNDGRPFCHVSRFSRTRHHIFLKPLSPAIDNLIAIR